MSQKEFSASRSEAHCLSRLERWTPYAMLAKHIRMTHLGATVTMDFASQQVSGQKCFFGEWQYHKVILKCDTIVRIFAMFHPRVTILT